MIAMKRDCLSDNELRQVLHGEMNAAEFDSAILHLDQCDTCRASVDTIQENTSGVKAPFTALPTDELQNETACQVALHKILLSPAVHAGKQPFGGDSLGSSSQGSGTAVPCETLGPYQLMSQLGVGGMGTVYLAQHQRLKRQCAIKLLPRDRVGQPGWLERFDREMITVASLEHPHVVRATDAGHESGWHYLVMEHLDGMDVSRVARRMGQLSVADACEIVRQAALGLAHVHDSGLVHRDIKPSNLMLTRKGIVKLLDLGLVLPGDDPLAVDDRLTTVGHVMGTMPYMAPEQLSDSRCVDPRSDLYALGATLYRLIAGSPPHGRRHGLAAQVIAITSEDAARLDTLREDVDREVVELVAEMLDRDAVKRPQSAVKVAERLVRPSEGSHLKGLIREAVRRPGNDSLEPGSFLPSVQGQPQSPREPVWRHWIAGAMAAGFLFFAAFVIKIQTDKGTLVVHSDVDGLTVLVKRGEEVVETLTIDSTKENIQILHKGTYRVEIQDGGKALKLSEEVVTIGRSETTPISISPTGAAEKTVASNPNTNAPSQDPRYATLRKARETILTAADLDTVGEAMVESVELIDGFLRPRSFGGENEMRIYHEEQRKVADAILQRARELGGTESRIPPPQHSNAFKVSPSEHFMWYFDQTYYRISSEVAMDAVVQELQDGNGRSRAASLRYLNRFSSRDPINHYIIPKRLRVCSGLVTVEGNETAWEGLPESQRSVAAKWAYDEVLRLCSSRNIDPLTLPMVEKVMKAKPIDELTMVERGFRNINDNPVQNIAPADVATGGNRVKADTVVVASDLGPRSLPPSSSTDPDAPLVFKGKDLSQWLLLLGTERDVVSLKEVIMAVEVLTKDSDERAEAATATLKVARSLGGLSSTNSIENLNSIQNLDGNSQYFMHVLRKTFPAYFPEPGIAAITNELDEGVGNQNSQNAGIWLLMEYCSKSYADKWFHKDHPSNQRKVLIDRLSDNLIRIAGDLESAPLSVSFPEKMRTHAREHALYTAISIRLMSGRAIKEKLLIDYVIKKVDHAMTWHAKIKSMEYKDSDDSVFLLETMWSTAPLNEYLLTAAIQLTMTSNGKQHPSLSSDEHWRMYASVLLTPSFIVRSESTQSLFDAVAKRPEILAEVIEKQIERIRTFDNTRTVMGGGSGKTGLEAADLSTRSNSHRSSVWKQALPFIAEKTSNAESLAKTLFDHSSFLNANNKQPMPELTEAIATLQARLKE